MRVALPALRRSRIPLTSLVDVVFILLFFFMLASRHLDWRALPVDLAAVHDVADDPAAEPALTVLLLAGGELRLGSRPSTAEEIVATIRADAGQRAVMLVPAHGVSVQATVDALDALAPSGARIVLGRLAEPSP